MADILSCLQWKVEPVSPAGFPDLDSEVTESWGLFEDEEVQQQKKTQTDTVHKQEKSLELSRAEVASKLLQDLDEWIKEEPFSDWLEEKIDLPIFEELPGIESRGYGHGFRPCFEAVKPQTTPTLVSIMTVPTTISTSAEVKSLPVPHHVMVPQDTQSLLREFETVYGEVELTHGTLTPPQSPPIPTYTNITPQERKGEELITLQQMIPIQPIISPTVPFMKISPVSSVVPIVYASDRKETLLPLEQLVPETPSPDLARELAAVDELIRTRVEDLVDVGSSQCMPGPWDSCGSGNVSSSSSGVESEGEMCIVAPPSPCTSSSGSSSYGSGEEMCDDPEWIPATIEQPSTGCIKSGRKRGGGTKPYSRPAVEEKRMRKKEQNKNAATRYRQKKKAEIEEILGEEKGLEEKNTELHLKVSDLSREIKYLKGLMRDLFKAKGLIK